MVHFAGKAAEDFLPTSSNMAETFLPQSLQIVAGSEAGRKWMSEDFLARAASADKALHVVDGADHMMLYEGQQYVAEAISVLAPFFTKHLAA